MSESLAGVTFLAFGNGSPDVFSTFAAMSTNSGSLAVGELIGAAGFITAVVAGSMALVRPFKVARKSFVRDVGFFIVAASFSMVFLADGYLHLWECAVMVAFYIFYVVTVVTWHWYLGRRRKNREREALIRGSYLVPEEDVPATSEEPDEQVGLAPRGRGISRGSTMEDFSSLERAGSPYAPELEGEEDDNTRDRWMAEISRNMRVSRQAPRDGQHTRNPIRPSLVGALEFRAILSSLNKSRSHQSSTINLRRYSDDPGYTLAQQQQNLSAAMEPNNSAYPEDVHQVVANNFGIYSDASERSTRTRAVSTNDLDDLQLNTTPMGPTIDLLGPTPPVTASLQRPEISISTQPIESASPSLLVSSPDGLVSDTARWPPSTPAVGSDHLAPPPNGPRTPSTKDRQPLGPQLERSNLSLLSPRSRTQRQWSGNSLVSTGSSSAVPFPAYFDDPNFFPSISRGSSILPSSPSIGYQTILSPDQADPQFQKRISWWPYSCLPPPHIVVSTLFPTLYGWRDKSIGEKLLGLVAAPSVLLLAITLPVVEVDGEAEDQTEVTQNGPVQGGGQTHIQGYTDVITASPDHNPNIEPADVGPEIHSESVRPPQPFHGDSYFGVAGLKTPEIEVPRIEIPHRRTDTANKSIEPLRNRSLSLPAEQPLSAKDWNRWLVCTQIFSAPLFVVLIAWARFDETLSPRNLLFLGLYSLIGSLVALVFILWTTDPVTPPRYRILLCFVGFIVSIAWISTIANEVVGVLKAVGVILNISDAILGLTIFAVGNSLGDLVADITVARLGYPVMALSACFGGPMLNILLGIGVSGLYMTISNSNKKHRKHPGQPQKYKPYQVEVGGTLMISAVTLLITLVGLLVMVPLNKWMMDRRIGWVLIILWCLSTIGNLGVEMAGLDGDIAGFLRY
jgi:sodium/potassium/calcium exchanger 6